VHGRDQLTAVAEDVDRGIGLIELDGNTSLLRRRPDPLDRLGHHQVDVDGLAGRRLLGLDAAQVEQVVDDPADPEGLGVDARRQPLSHFRIGLDGEGLGQQPEGPDRGLELVAHVGHEVAADLLQAPPVGHVLDDGDHAEGPPPVVDQPGPDGEGLAGRPVEVEGALGRAVGPGVLQELGDGLGGQGVAVAIVHEPGGPGVLEGDVAVLVADDDPLGQGVEGPAEPDGVRTGLGDRLGRLAGDLLEVAEHRLDPPVVGGLHAEAVGQGGQPLLQGPPPGPAPQPGGDDDGQDGDDAQHDVPDDIRLHSPSMAGRWLSCDDASSFEGKIMK
jgi:hypothetical protein